MTQAFAGELEDDTVEGCGHGVRGKKVLSRLIDC
jgi:hypothetical protein